MSLAPRPESVPAVRRFVRTTLQSWGATDNGDTVELLVSELATNSVLHAQSHFTVELSLLQGTLRVGVHDMSSVSPRSRKGDEEATGGRGVRLVAVLASAWGLVRQQGAGKVVWFHVPAAGPITPVARRWEDSSDLPVPVQRHLEVDLRALEAPTG
jgi:anti-sigma regulatory factor (Ser/Thr protein kinase)